MRLVDVTGWTGPPVDDQDTDFLSALLAQRPGEDNLGALTALLRQVRPTWHNDAACRGMGPDLFHPERGEPVAPALEVCASCTVVEPCRAAGQHGVVGVWGGTTRLQRRRDRQTAA